MIVCFSRVVGLGILCQVLYTWWDVTCWSPVVPLLLLGVVRSIKCFSLPEFCPLARPHGSVPNVCDDERHGVLQPLKEHSMYDYSVSIRA